MHYFSERETSSQYPVESGLKNYETASFLPTTKTSNSEESRKKSLLNTSYSSEEILLQAASSLQGLEGKVYSSEFSVLHRVGKIILLSTNMQYVLLHPMIKLDF